MRQKRGAIGTFSTSRKSALPVEKGGPCLNFFLITGTEQGDGTIVLKGSCAEREGASPSGAADGMLYIDMI